MSEFNGRDCPYYQGNGVCESGCYSEPSCVTDEPRGGWPILPRHNPYAPSTDPQSPYQLYFQGRKVEKGEVTNDD